MVHGIFNASGGSGNGPGIGYSSGKANSVLNGGTGTGGLLILYANRIINNKEITANGVAIPMSAPAGGPSGGGTINIFYKASFINNDIIQSIGGKNPAASQNEERYGGNGTVSIGSISSGTYKEYQD